MGRGMILVTGMAFLLFAAPVYAAPADADRIPVEHEIDAETADRYPDSAVSIAERISDTIFRMYGKTADRIKNEAAGQGMYREYAEEGPYEEYAEEGPYELYAEEGPYTEYAEQGPYEDYAGNGLYRSIPYDIQDAEAEYAEEGPYELYAEEGPYTEYAEQGPYEMYAEEGPYDGTPACECMHCRCMG